MSCGLREELKEESPLFTWVIQPCEGGARSFEGAGWDTWGCCLHWDIPACSRTAGMCVCSCHLSSVEGYVSRALQLLKNSLVSFRDVHVGLEMTLLSTSQAASMVGGPSLIFGVSTRGSFSFIEILARI